MEVLQSLEQSADASENTSSTSGITELKFDNVFQECSRQLHQVLVDYQASLHLAVRCCQEDLGKLQ